MIIVKIYFVASTRFLFVITKLDDEEGCMYLFHRQIYIEFPKISNLFIKGAALLVGPHRKNDLFCYDRHSASTSTNHLNLNKESSCSGHILS